MLFTAIESLAKFIILMIIFIVATPLILILSFFGKEKYFSKMKKSFSQVANTSLKLI